MWSQVCLLWQAVESVLAEQQPAGAAGTGRGPGFAGVAAVAAVADQHGVAADTTAAAGTGAKPAG
ncbi:hypothetical protein [Mycobacterium tuberculosis]|uniref:hypothetical protein n=1 Tax=Mycobacterium tuberculosis TaxID=1773 RepID=UPI00070F198A|nr:hypothetical protein [Mycobacterium tuberculosis]